jgi:hypothetical protein
VLWLEDIPVSIGVHVSLAGADQVSRTPTVEEYVLACIESRQSSSRSDTEANVAEIKYSIRDGHSHAQILVCRHSLLELSHLVHQEYKAKC